MALPTTEEVIEALQRHGAELRVLRITGPRGPTVRSFFRRQDGDDVWFSGFVEEGQYLGWETLHRLCRNLRIDFEELELKTRRPPSWWWRAPDAD